MTQHEILQRIRETATMLGGDAMAQIEPSSDLRDLGLDSMDLVEVVSVFEDTFDIRLADEALRDVKTAQDLVVVIERSLASAKA